MTDIPTAFQQPIEIPNISGQPVNMPEDKFALTGWKPKPAEEFDVQVPSGQWCRVRKLSSPDLFKLGLIDMLDMFSPELLGGGDSDAQAEEITRAENMRDKGKRDKLFETIDKVVISCVVKPQVTDNKKMAAANPSTHVLVEDIELPDKMFIFGRAFGADIATMKSALPK